MDGCNLYADLRAMQQYDQGRLCSREGARVPLSMSPKPCAASHAEKASGVGTAFRLVGVRFAHRLLPSDHQSFAGNDLILLVRVLSNPTPSRRAFSIVTA
jgi:hypothetical protein